MAETDSFPDLSGYITAREAAKMLHISIKETYRYIRSKRLPAFKPGRDYMIPKQAVEEFKRKTAGRPREKAPPWHAYQAGVLLATEIRVRVYAGQQKRLLEKLQAIQEGNRHAFTGTIQRYVIEGDALLTTAIISLIWKDIEMPDEATRQRELAAFKQELADVLDWDSATESTNRVLIHT